MAEPTAHPPTTTVREAVLALCRATGMTTVFGNPGSTELRMFRDWPEDFRYVLGLHESTAVAMAAGHALGTGRAALVSLHRSRPRDRVRQRPCPGTDGQAHHRGDDTDGRP
ncbi:thiamine pyrophosphate-binding protein, partial [Streptomyces asiaticus]